MENKNIYISLAVIAVLAGGIYVATQIDWNTEGDKMAQEISDKYWNDELDKIKDDLANKAEEIDWKAEGDKMAYELSDESALAKYNEIDWNKEASIMADDLKTRAYVGKWEQVATYMNGEAQDSAKAVLTLSKNSYESQTSCTVAGKLSVSGDNMTMAVQNDGCTGGKVQGSFTYKYEISRDGGLLILDYAQAGFNMREVFKKKK